MIVWADCEIKVQEIELKYLKYALVGFALVDFVIFIAAQVSPTTLVGLLPQFDIESENNSYPRLVGVLFLMLGLARLYGALHMNEQGAFAVSMWSWVVELIYTTSELLRGQFVLTENLLGLILAPLMLIWSIQYYRIKFAKRS